MIKNSSKFYSETKQKLPGLTKSKKIKCKMRHFNDIDCETTKIVSLEIPFSEEKAK